MNNIAQLLLTAVIITLTLMIVLVTVSVLQILHEIHQVIKRANDMLASGKPVSEAVSEIHRFFHRAGTPLKK